MKRSFPLFLFLTVLLTTSAYAVGDFPLTKECTFDSSYVGTSSSQAGYSQVGVPTTGDVPETVDGSWVAEYNSNANTLTLYPSGDGVKFDASSSNEDAAQVALELSYEAYLKLGLSLTPTELAFSGKQKGAPTVVFKDTDSNTVDLTGFLDLPTPDSGTILTDAEKLEYAWYRYLGYSFGVSDDSLEAVLTTAVDLQNNAAQDALERLGDYPTTGTTSYQQALWSARYYLITGEEGPVSASDADYGSVEADLKRYYIRALYTLHTGLNPDSTYSLIAGPTAAPRPIDTATSAYALEKYLSLYQSGALNTQYDYWEAWVYKLQATMGLASGILSPSETEGVADFLSAAYVSTLANYRSLMYGIVDYPRSGHLGDTVNSLYYEYLVTCYQEFGIYATVIIEALAPAILDETTTYRSLANEVNALSALYEALSWADDDALWRFWNSEKPTRDGVTLKEIYEYLYSSGAMEACQNYDISSTETAFRYFFSTDAGFELSSYMQEGITASASFLPLRTNLYDPYTFTDLVDTDWLLDFHAKFGYNRKALYIDTNVDAALNYQRTGSKGSLRVCTLEDLLNADVDIVLYLDDNLYNVDTLAEMTNKAFDRVSNSAQGSTTRGLVEEFLAIWDVSMANLAKTAENTLYSQKVQRQLQRGSFLNDWGSFFFDPATSLEYLRADDVASDEPASTYTPLTAFAVISAIYQEEAVFETLNNTFSVNTPVFISSPTLPYVTGVSDVERQIIYNYLLLKNLDSQMTVDYATNLDMTSPVYMDIYGNIVTESGLVVVPAAANATLWKASYLPYNAALYSVYGDDFFLPYEEAATQLNDMLSSIFTPVDDTWQLSSVKVNGGHIDLSKLSTADKESLAAVAEIFAYDLSTGKLYSDGIWEMIITEVLRGAPIEHIDKEFENLNLSHTTTVAGLSIAEKLEFLVNALSPVDGTNATLSIPNLAYMDGLEYVIFFAFKILILCILVVWMLSIYLDAVGGVIGLRTAVKCVGVVALVLSLIVGVPAVFDLSYYQSNKMLLQEETEYLMMLNLEKKEYGQEVGITSVHEPDTTTTLYLHLADIDVPWYKLLPKILTSSSYQTLEELYRDYETYHPVAEEEGVTVMNGAVYVTTDQLFDSSYVSFSTTTSTLFQKSTGSTPASYYTPYYYFLDQLIYRANRYAITNDQYAYTTKVQRGGRLKTLGFVEAYFTSDYFMQEGMDYFGLYDLYEVTAPVSFEDAMSLSEETLAATQTSHWCNLSISEAARERRIEALNDYVRQWVAEHVGLIGKVSDETFLKCLALSCAMEHNRLFNTLRADNLEIYRLSNEDLMRLSMTDAETVMRGSSLSYARFVYTVGGTPAVFAAALLTLVNFVSSWVKPLASLAVFVITCISIFWFKLILRRGNNSVYGYICTIFLMCVVNFTGSLLLKLSMYIPNLGLSPTVCILLQILAQIAYMYVLAWVVRVAVSDWKNVGFDHYNQAYSRLHRRDHYSHDVLTPKQKNGWAYYDRLVERQQRRARIL